MATNLKQSLADAISNHFTCGVILFVADLFLVCQKWKQKNLIQFRVSDVSRVGN